MRQRRRSLAKILVLQEQLSKLNAWKLAALDQQRVALEETQREMIEAIDRDAIANRILVTTATHRLRNIGAQMATVEAEHVVQTERAREQAMRAKLAERLVDNLEVKYRRHQERVELGDLIESAIARKSASPA